MKNILIKIDPQKSSDLNLVKNYSHLLNFAKWTIAASEIAMNRVII